MWSSYYANIPQKEERRQVDPPPPTSVPFPRSNDEVEEKRSYVKYSASDSSPSLAAAPTSASAPVDVPAAAPVPHSQQQAKQE